RRDVRSPSGQNLITKKIRGEENTLEITADQHGLPRIEPFSFRMILLLIRVHPRKSAVKVSSLFSRRRRALGLASAHGAAARAKTTAAWAFTDVAGGAGASTCLDCMRSGAQLAQGKCAGGKSGCEHRGEH